MSTRSRNTGPKPPLSYHQTVAGLRDGLGVEDISVKHGQHLDLIRRHVDALRRDGTLAEIYRRGAA